MSGSATVTGTLLGDGVLAAAITGTSSTVFAGLAITQLEATTITGSSTLTASATALGLMVANITNSVIINARLDQSGTVQAQSTITASSTLYGLLEDRRLISSAITGSASVSSVVLTGAGDMIAPITGVGALTGTVLGNVQIAAAINASSTITGLAADVRSLAATITNTSTVVAPIIGTVFGDLVLVCSSTFTATLNGTTPDLAVA